MGRETEERAIPTADIATPRATTAPTPRMILFMFCACSCRKEVPDFPLSVSMLIALMMPCIAPIASTLNVSPILMESFWNAEIVLPMEPATLLFNSSAKSCKKSTAPSLVKSRLRILSSIWSAPTDNNLTAAPTCLMSKRPPTAETNSASLVNIFRLSSSFRTVSVRDRNPLSSSVRKLLKSRPNLFNCLSVSSPSCADLSLRVIPLSDVPAIDDEAKPSLRIEATATNSLNCFGSSCMLLERTPPGNFSASVSSVMLIFACVVAFARTATSFTIAAGLNPLPALSSSFPKAFMTDSRPSAISWGSSPGMTDAACANAFMTETFLGLFLSLLTST